MKPQDAPLCMKRFFQTEYKKGRLIAFGNYDEAVKQGLPTLSTINKVAESLSLITKHFGYGCFGAFDSQSREWFSFFGGGAMITSPEGVLANPGDEPIAHRLAQYTPIQITLNGPRVKRAFRALCPEAFAKEPTL